MGALKELDVVALLCDRLDLGVQRGWVGTLLLEVGAGVWEVEFSDDEGQAITTVPLPAKELLRLHMHPVPA